MELVNILLDKKDNIMTVTINRPDVLNALNTATLKEMYHVLRNETDDVRVVILTGAGERAFVAGSDIHEMAYMNAFEFKQYGTLYLNTLNAIRNLDKPVIAAVNGVAFGGGNSLALSCDFVIAVEDAQFGQQEINLGIFGGATIVTELAGRMRAADMVLTGRTVSANEALEWGLINKVVPRSAFNDEVMKLARHLASRPPIALSFAKQAINNTLRMPLDAASNYEIELLCLCFDTEDQKEGMRAFIEKRKPTYHGK
jgi:enoyl-CoA hydratase/carnithine racemase